MISSRHKMILSSGRFSGTSREQLAAAFDTFAGSKQKETLVVHFHGGLVNESNALATAERLLPIYQDAGGYPLFVIWHSGLGETLKNNWQEIIQEDVFPVLVKRVVQFVVGKLNQSPGEEGGEVALPTPVAVEIEIMQKQAAGEEPFTDREAETANLDSELMSGEQAQFQALLASDEALAIAAIKLSREDAPELSPTLEAELDQAHTSEDLGEMVSISTTALVTAGVRILAQVLKRFAAGSDHGIYTTVVEEVIRELKGDLVAGIVWKHMKKDTADSFEGPSETHGGTALLEEIGRIWQSGHRPRLVLVGHSAGAVYICNLLQKAATMLPAEIHFEVVFLAPACSFDLLDRALTQIGDRIVFLRSFGMEDEIEKQDAIFPPFYMRSLLYFVSGVTEEAIDLPLVGMKRYHSGAPPFDAKVLPQIKQVYDRLIAVTEPWIWSEHNAGAGLNTLARKHGDFDNEKMTLDSVVHLITQGVS